MKICAVILLFITVAFTPVKPFKQVGQAYVYAEKLKGRPTFSGEKYNPNLLTAAHATLPMHTIVQVTNLNNGKKVLVKINDRMARKRYTIIDLSKAAARKIDALRQGGAPVRIERNAKFTTQEYQAAIAADTTASDSL